MKENIAVKKIWQDNDSDDLKSNKKKKKSKNHSIDNEQTSIISTRKGYFTEFF